MSDEHDDEAVDGPELLTQPGLVGAVLGCLGRFGIDGVTTRQMNAIIAGVDVMYDALIRDDVRAKADMGLTAWLASDDTGLSSRYLATVLSGRECRRPTRWGYEVDYPRDPDDFGRCHRMLKACPDFVPHLPRLASPEHGRVWNALYAAWDELTVLWEEESPSGRCPKLYQSMRAIIETAEKPK